MKRQQTMIAIMIATATVLLTGCAFAKEPGASTKPAHSDVPIDDKKLHEWLRAGAYKKFAAQESKNHPSAGPHTKYGLPVRVYMESKIHDSLEAGNLEHPVGSAIVKEMFNAESVLEGWAVMVKTQEKGDAGKGWYWYEATSTAPGTKAFASGNGIKLCSSCHGGGQDFVLTKYPLK